MSLTPVHSRPVLDGLRVLIVDDLAVAAETLALLLELEGAQVRTALCGQDALALAREFLPHAVILDLGLPDMDGAEVARRLRLMPGLRAALLIALTGYSQAMGPGARHGHAFDAYLVKPADTDKLLAYLLSAIPVE